jgi:hypothetical protein
MQRPSDEIQVRSQSDYFRDIKQTEIGEETLEAGREPYRGETSKARYEQV